MKALIFSLNYAPEPTATGKYTGEMAAWLAGSECDVEAIVGLPHYPQWKLDPEYAEGRSRVECLEGVIVRRTSHFIPGAGGLGAIARIRMETSFTLSAARYWVPKIFAPKKPDVVIAVMPPMQIGFWPLIYGWIRRIPWVLHIQDLQVDAALRLNMVPGGLLGKLLYRIEGFILRRATRVSTITEAMRRRVIAKGVPESRTWLFPNWADIDRVHPMGGNNGFREELGIGPDKVVVLYAGGIGEKQGLEVVVDAASRLRDQGNLEFLIVGDGAAREDLVQQAERLDVQNLRFLPVQPLEKLPEMLAAGDIHLVIQRGDAADLVMPSKLTNILAAGRPCVATAKKGTALADVLDGGGMGVITPPDDAAGLADAIMALAKDDRKRQQFGTAARAYAEQSLDKDRILGEFMRKLSTLAKKGSNVDG